MGTVTVVFKNIIPSKYEVMRNLLHGESCMCRRPARIRRFGDVLKKAALTDGGKMVLIDREWEDDDIPF